VISATALVGFFLNFTWGLGIATFTRVPYNPLTDAGETAVIAGVASMLVTTVVLFSAARLLIDLAAAPPGALAALFTISALLVSVAFDEDAEGVAAAAVAGVAIELLVSRRGPSRPSRSVGLAFGVASAVLWLGYLGLLRAIDGIAWQAEIWLGGAALSSLCAVAVATLNPPAPITTAGGNP
jgi:hypothetical protein